MSRMNAGQAVVRGFRLSWREWTGGRRRGRAAVPSEPLADLKCWTVVRIPQRRRGQLAESARRR